MPRGRKAAAEQQMAVAVRSERVPPPADLSCEELEAWTDFVNAMPAGWLTPAMIPLIKTHIRTAVIADQVAMRQNMHMLRAQEEGSVGTPKEANDWRNLVNTHLGIAKSIHASSTKLMAAPSATYDREKSKEGTSKGSEVWNG